MDYNERLDVEGHQHVPPGSRKSWLGPTLVFALAGVVTAISLAACSNGKPAPVDRASAGCYSGQFQLQASPAAAAKGQMITLSASGKWPVRDTFHNVGTDSYGLLGTSSNGKFVAKYNVAAIAQGVQRNPNIPVGSSNALGGVGLPNRPFQVQVPPVSAGRYIVKFVYVVTPDGGGKPKPYDLCASLTVTTN